MQDGDIRRRIGPTENHFGLIGALHPQQRFNQVRNGRPRRGAFVDTIRLDERKALRHHDDIFSRRNRAPFGLNNWVNGLGRLRLSADLLHLFDQRPLLLRQLLVASLHFVQVGIVTMERRRSRRAFHYRTALTCGSVDDFW